MKSTRGLMKTLTVALALAAGLGLALGGTLHDPALGAALGAVVGAALGGALERPTPTRDALDANRAAAPSPAGRDVREGRHG